MTNIRYRLALAVTSREMSQIATALRIEFPALAQAIEAQQLEIANTSINVFEPFVHDSSEPIVGMSASKIETMLRYID